MRLLAIADPHGCYDKLVELLEKVKYDPSKDKLVLLGDYVDRGPKPMKTLLFVGKLIEQGAIAIDGNHDQMFRELVDNGTCFQALSSPYYIRLGADVTVKDFYGLSANQQMEVKDVLHKLVPYYVHDNYVFVHGGVSASLSVDKNDPDDLRWMREEFYEYKAYENKIVVFGHTPTCNLHEDESVVIWYDEKYGDKIGIDCACVYGGRLACLDLTNKIEYYV